MSLETESVHETLNTLRLVTETFQMAGETQRFLQVPSGCGESHKGRRSQKGICFLNSSPETKDNGDTASKTREEIFLI